jgi:phosphoglycerol geranylgeranyltransferase
MKKVEAHLNAKISERGCIHLALVDPDKCDPTFAKHVSQEASNLGSTALMVGGSTSVGGDYLDSVIKGLKSGSDLPVILFPGNLFGVSKYADAVWFMSVLNSTNPFYITGAQAVGSRMVRAFDLEALPMGYIIVSPGGTAGFISQANEIPFDKPEAALIYALAAQYLGMRFVYLERGSGVEAPISQAMVRMTKKALSEAKLIVGGGIRRREQAREVAQAGADIIVTGTVLEEKGMGMTLSEILAGIEEGVNARKT